MFRGDPVYALVVAAGESRRMAGQDKIFALLAGVPVLARTVETLLTSPWIDQVVVVLRAERLAAGQELAAERHWGRRVAFCAGGKRRQDSVRLGLDQIAGDGWVLVHDGARPFFSPQLVERGLEAALETGAAIPGIPVPDTIKRVSPDGRVEETVPREMLRAVQTPQVFQLELLREAHRRLAESEQPFTDDAALLEALGHKVVVFPGEADNVKVTTPTDLRRAEARARAPYEEEAMSEVRVGIGYDIHRLRAGRRLVLGGVEIPSPRGLVGHSDADVLAHAVMDALLGTAGLGDIGTHFPPSDPAFKDANSMELLARVRSLLDGAGWQPRQVSAVLVAERPRLAAYVSAMRTNVAAALGVPVDAVSVQVTTNERIGALGRGEGIAAWATAVARKRVEEHSVR